MPTSKAPVDSRPFNWRPGVLGALVALLVTAALLALLTARNPAPIQAPSSQRAFRSASIISLPIGAQVAVSSTLGANNADYRVLRADGRMAAQNPAQRFQSTFAPTGVSVTASQSRVGLRVTRIGYGYYLRRVPTAHPRELQNQITYQYPALTAWYRNGPLGLEQGFTVPKPATAQHGQVLTIAMSVSGNLAARLVPHTNKIVFLKDGRRVLQYSGLFATDATGRHLGAWLELRGHELVTRVLTANARYPLTIDPIVQQGEKLTGSGETGKGYFGLSVALSTDGNTALVGGFFDNSEVGAAWVFARFGSAWVQQGPKLTGGEESGNASFGWSVALSANGNTALVGGHLDGSQAGAVWVFARTGTTWSQQGSKLTATEETAGDHFGESVALSADGNTALIGSPHDGPNARVGAAWVFTRSGSTWSQQGTKLIGSSSGEAEFGQSVALSAEGNTALIGGPTYSNRLGAAWVFTRTGSTWSPQGSKLIGGGQSGEAEFGHSVALSANGHTALIGGPVDNSTAGAAWVFTRTESTWSQQGTELTGGGESGGAEFGYSVALSEEGNTALIGGPVDNGDVGAAWDFQRSGSTWSQQGSKLTDPGEPAGAYFSRSVALSGSGNTALVGAYGENKDVGGAFVLVNPPEPPTVVTGSASALTEGSAVIGATVNPNGSEITACSFEYGPGASYGTTVACAEKPGAGNVAVEVSAAVTGLAVGSTYHYRIIVTNAGGTNYGTDQTFTTSRGAQTIAFTSTPEPTSSVGGSYTVSATGGESGNPVTFSINSDSTAGACTISGPVVHFTGIGTCIVAANQEGSARYYAAPTVLQQLPVAQGQQTITFTTTPPETPDVGTAYVVEATGGGSGNPLAYSINNRGASTPGACSISGRTVTLTGGGYCTIEVTQAGNSNYLEGIGHQYLTVGPGAPPKYVSQWGSAGTGPGRFANPNAIAVNSVGDLYVTDSGNHRVEEFDPVGKFITSWGSEGSGPGQFETPNGIAVNPVGDVYVSDAAQSSRIEEFDGGGRFIREWGKKGSGPGEFESPRGLAIGATGNVYVTDYGNARVEEFTPTGGYLQSFGVEERGEKPGRLLGPWGVAVSAEGDVYVTSTGYFPIDEFGPTGAYINRWPVRVGGNAEVVFPTGLTSDANGNLYLANSETNTIDEYSATGNLLTEWGEGGTGNGDFTGPSAIAVNASGEIYVVDTINNRVQRFSFGPARASQEVSFTTAPPAHSTVGGVYDVEATGGGSGNPVTLSIDPLATPGACSLNGHEVAMTGVGICIVDGNQQGNASYLAADQSQQVFGVGRATQAITFTSPLPSNPIVGSSYTVTATGGASGNPVVFTTDPLSTLGACLLEGSEVRFTLPGTCVVDANQPGAANYELAPQVSQTITVTVPPVALTTGPAIYLTHTSATLTATVDPNGVTVSACAFEYGPTATYGHAVPCWTELSPHAGATEVRAALYALTAGGRYHFRIAVHADGVVAYGSDNEFQLQEHASTVLSLEQGKFGEGSGTYSFGTQVVMSADGSTALVSSSSEGPAKPEAVFVFVHALAGWIQQAELPRPEGPDAPPPAPLFGNSMALSADGNTAIIGAESDGNGTAWIYSRVGDAWSPEPAKLEASGGAAHSRFGSAVALSASGNYAAVGAWYNENGVGAAYLFEKTSTGWVQQGSKLVGAGETGAGDFGYSLALSAEGNTLVVGAPFDNGGRGAAWTFTRTREAWSEQGGKLVGGGEHGNGIFGNIVALSADGNTAIIGAPWEEISGTLNGSVYTFHRTTGEWTESASKLFAAQEPNAAKATFFGFGLALSADGQTAVIGSLDDNGVVGNVGSARLYNFRSGEWVQQGQRITGAGQVGQSNFGVTVALSGDGGSALVGGPSDDNWEGSVWGFEAPQIAPTTTTGPAAEVATRRATVNGTVVPNGRSVSTCTIEYGPTASYGSEAACSTLPGGGIEPVAITANLEGLTPDTTYHFRLATANSVATTYGANETFTTTGLATPSGVAATPGKGEATVSWTERGTIAGETYTVTADDLTNPSRGGESVSSTTTQAVVGDLTPSDTYSFSVTASASAEASEESSASNAVTIEALLPVAPSATTERATEAGATTAILAATVNPNGSAVTECRFDFGTTDAYGETVPCAGSAGAGAEPVQVLGHVSGLSGNTTYHFRVVVTNAAGTVYGADETLTTTSGAPTVATSPATEVLPHSAVLNGTVNTNGSEATECFFEYGPQPPFTSTVPCASLPGSRSAVVAVAAASGELRGRTTYEYRLVVANSYGAPHSSIASFTTPATGGFEPPTTVEAAGGVGTATVSWAEPYETGNSPLMSYTVTATDTTTPANGGQATTASGSPAVVTGLHGGDTYTFVVVAKNLAGAFSPASESSNPVLIDQVPAITSPAAASIGMRTSVDLTVTTTGTPTPSIAEAGNLPTGVTFTDNEDGTGTFSGSAAAGTAGTYPLEIVGANETGQTAIQHFVLTVTTATSAPAITSEAETEQSLQLPFSFTVTTSGYPAPTLTKTGALPAGVTFVNNGDGSATVAGTPTTGGLFTVKVTAKSSAGTTTQSIAIKITASPVFTRIPTTKSTVGTAMTLKIRAKGYLAPTFAMASGGTSALPVGLTLVDEGDGKAVISGTPAAKAGGIYTPMVLARNASGEASDAFTLEVREAPAITSAATATATVGDATSIRFTAAGFPAPSITRNGALPKGLTYIGADHEITGTPKAGTAGTYPITVLANNSAGKNEQHFVLTVR
jgi:hypothetical protein